MIMDGLNGADEKFPKMLLYLFCNIPKFLEKFVFVSAKKIAICGICLSASCFSKFFCSRNISPKVLWSAAYNFI